MGNIEIGFTTEISKASRHILLVLPSKYQRKDAGEGLTDLGYFRSLNNDLPSGRGQPAQKHGILEIFLDLLELYDEKLIFGTKGSPFVLFGARVLAPHPTCPLHRQNLIGLQFRAKSHRWLL